MNRTAVVSVIAALVVFLLVWQAVVIVSGFPPFILPAPGAVLERLAQLLRLHGVRKPNPAADTAIPRAIIPSDASASPRLRCASALLGS